MRTKDFPLEVRGVEDSGVFEGYAAIYGNVDAYNEVLSPGAAAKSLAKHKREGTKPLLLWQHKPDEPIGVWEDLAEDGKGLWGRGRLLKGVRRADEAHILLKGGAVRGMSIGYREVQTEPGEKGAPRKIVEIDLWEASLVSFPANKRARVEAVKHEHMEDFARRLRDGDPPHIKEFEDVLREAGFPKALAVQIASVGYAKAIRSESEGKATAVRELRAAVSAFSSLK